MISEEGMELIKDCEGCRLESYEDVAGVLTIGYGHTGKNVVPGMKIDQKIAEMLLANDLTTSEKAITNLVKVKLNKNQLAALVSFVFNLGFGNLQKSTLLLKLNKGDYVGASQEFVKWNHAGGKINNGLTIRRLKEKELFLTPVE